MKKLSIIIFLCAFALTGCEPTTFFNYEIKNITQSDVTVEIGGQEPMTIKSGSTDMVYNFSRIGEWNTEPIGIGGYIVPYALKVRIDDKSMSDNFWQREYWNYKNKDKHHWTYTLILTDELIENLLSEKEL